MSVNIPTSMDQCINKRELYDVNAVHWLLTHPELITPEEKRILRGLKRKTVNINEHECSYKLGSKANHTSFTGPEFHLVGRWIADRGVGLQGLSSDIRALLAKDYYFDIDIVNAHPTILLDMCNKKGWDCKYNKELVTRREEFFTEWKKESPKYTRDHCKIEILRMMFGGKPVVGETPSWIIKNYYPELRKIMANIANENTTMYTRQKKTKPHNPEGSVAALILQTEERKCLLSLESYLQQQGRQLDVLIHDGGYVRRKPGEESFPEGLLREAEKFIYEKTGYVLKLLEKPLTTTITVPDGPKQDPSKTYESMKVEFEKTRFKCIRNIHFYEVTDEYITCKNRRDFIDTYENLKFQEANKDGAIVDVKFVPRWLEDPDMRQYSEMRIFLPPEEPRPDQYNLWEGFRIENEQYTCDRSEMGRDILLDHIKLVAGDECYDYVLKWIALLFQKPAVKPNVCILIKSDQGIGKGLIFDILNLMIGKQYCYTTARIDKVVGNFNVMLKDKLLVALDEHERMKDSTSGIIKDLITNPNITLEKKNVDPVEYPNLTHFLVFSNKSWPWKLEESDRRTLPIDRSREPKPTKEYIETVVEAMKDDMILRELFDYFMSIDIRNFNPERDRPETKFAKELKEFGRPVELEYFLHLFMSKDRDFVMSMKDIWEGFTDYMYTNLSDAIRRDHKSTSSQLALALRSYKIPGVTSARKKDGAYYIFEHKSIHQWMSDNKYI